MLHNIFQNRKTSQIMQNTKKKKIPNRDPFALIVPSPNVVHCSEILVAQ